MSRPTRVTVLAILALAWAILSLVYALVMVIWVRMLALVASVQSAPEVTRASFVLMIFGLVTGLTALAGLLFAVGVLRMMPWAWTLGVFIFVVQMVNGLIGIFLADIGFLEIVLGVVFPIGLLVYMCTAEIQEAFGRIPAGSLRRLE